MRKRWLWAAIVLAVALGAVGYLIFRPEAESTAHTAPTCQLLTPPSTPPVADSSGIRILDQGFSRVGAFGSAKASMGVLLRNETDKVAYRTLVTLDAVDAAGRTVVHEWHQPTRTQVVPVILPGDSVAVGSASLLDDLTQRQGRRIASTKVTIRVSQWLETGDGNNGLGRVTATVVAGSGERKPSGQGEVTFDVDSANCANMAPRGVSLVFRDRSGAISGGSLQNPPPLDTCKAGRNPGRKASMIESDIPARVDLDQTDITVYCDFSQSDTPLASGAPYN